MSIDAKIEKLLEMELIGKGDKITFTDDARKLIHEIANECNRIQFVKENQSKMDAYGEGLTAEQVYVDMLLKISNAPTKLHMRMSARALIPVIDKKIIEETNGGELT